MKKYGFLNKEQVKEYIKFLYKDNTPNITDYAFAMGCYVIDNEPISWSRVANGYKEARGLIAYYKDLEGKKVSEIKNISMNEDTVYDNYEDYDFHEKNPFFNEGLVYIPWISTDLLSEDNNIHYINERYGYTYFGKFPQKAFWINYQGKLTIDEESLSGEMFFYPEYDDFSMIERQKPIYIDNIGRNFIKCKVRRIHGGDKDRKVFVSNRIERTNYLINFNDYYGFLIEDIKWIVDKKKKIMFPEKGLFSGFCVWGTNKNNCWIGTFNVKDSPIYIYLEKFFLPYIFKDKVLLNEILDNHLENYTNRYEQDILKNAKKRTRMELDDFYSQIEKEMLEKLFGDNERKLFELSDEVYENVCDKLHKIIEEAFNMQNTSFDEELTKVNEELLNRINMLKSAIETKDGVIDYVEGELQDLTSKYSLLLDNKLAEHISLLEKSKDDIMSKISEFIKEKFISLTDDVDKLKDSINGEIDVLERKKQDLEKEIDRVYEKRNEVEKQITSEVIRKVAELNPVKEVTVTIDGVKNKGVSGLFHQDFEAILQLVSLKLPIFLVGPAGCGKNVILKQCSEVLDKKFYYQNDADEDYKLLGFVDANGIYHKTPFYDAFKNGGILMLDEMDNSNASVLLKLNSAIGSGNDFYMTFPNGETFNAHKDFQVVAAANTFGTGASQIYCGRNQIDGATLDRYFVYNLDYDKNLERALVNNKAILDVFWEIRRIVNENGIRHTVSTRAILNMDKIISSKIIGKGSFTIGDAFDGTLIKGLDVDDLNIIVARLKTNDFYSIKLLEYLRSKYSASQSEYKSKNVNDSKQYSRGGWYG